MNPEDRALSEALEEAARDTTAAMARTYPGRSDPRTKSERPAEMASNLRRALARRGYLIVDVRGAGPQASDGWRA